MPSQYHLQQRTASALSEICGINDIVETGSNANGWYCKFANGLTIIIGATSIAFPAGGDIVERNLTLPTGAIAFTGTGTIHTSSTPGGAAINTNFSIRETYANLALSPLGTWGNYTRDMYYIIATKWK